MKKALVLFIALFAITFAGDDYIMPIDGKVYVYQTETSEVVITSLKKGGTAKVVSKSNARYEVQVNDSLTGWVSKRDVSKVKSKQQTFTGVDVVGEDIYKGFEPVFGDDQAPITYEPLNRDFQNALKQNIDKEATERK